MHLELCDNYSRYPAAFALKSLSAKHVCNALLQLFQTTGIPSVIQSDCASNFLSSLTKTFLSLMGCSPRLNVPGRPQQSGLCERLIGILKRMTSKVAMDHPRSWYNYLGHVLTLCGLALRSTRMTRPRVHVLWSLRECPNESTNLPP